MNEMKSPYLERQFQNYVDGVPLPAVDLTAAKREAEARARRRRRGKIGAALSAVAVSLVLVVALGAQMASFLAGDRSPAGSVAMYSIAETVEEESSYTALRALSRDALAPYEKFALAANADARFTSYTLEEEVVLVRVDLSYAGKVHFEGSVYLDLTGGAKQAEEFTGYRELSEVYGGYRFETVYESAEYCSKAYAERAVPTYIDLISNSDGGLWTLLALL